MAAPIDLHACPHLHFEPVASSCRRAVFLDRDGVLIEDTGYPDDPAAVALLPGAAGALRLLRAAGWSLVVVSNQSGVARGRFSLSRLGEIHDRLLELLAREGATLDALYYCPHHPSGTELPYRAGCSHRKPEPGMLRSAAERLHLRLEECWMVGDKESDVAAAHAAGCRAVRIGEDVGAADGCRVIPVGEDPTTAEHCAVDLAEAARMILEETAGSVMQ